MNKIILENEIKNDKYTNYVYEAFDIQNQNNTKTEINYNFANLNDFEWNIGVIYGGSGSGKTTLLKQFGLINDVNFDNNKPLISNFDFMEPKDATMLLSSIGLSSVPVWLRPYKNLSNGEQYRAKLAYLVANADESETILIDEYTSVVDRDVAKAMSNSLQKYIRKNNKKVILASCHFDIMNWLQPDWIYSPYKGRIERPDCLRREKIELQIFRCRLSTWSLFKHHHYLSQNLNSSSNKYLIVWNDKPIGFIAILPFPHGNIQNGFRISRIVILPDFQGLGFGSKLCDYISGLYKKLNKTMYIKTSNPALWGFFEKSKNWQLVNEVKKEQLNTDWIKNMQTSDKILGYRNAITKSFKYVGIIVNDDTKIIEMKSDAYENWASNQILIEFN